MSGNIWKYSQHLDEEDCMFARRVFFSYKIGCEYYGLNEKPMRRMAWASGAVYKIGKKVLIRRDIFEEYLRNHQRIVEELVENDEQEILKAYEKHMKEGSFDE